MIEFPPLPSGEVPIWNGTAFKIGNTTTSVAAYSINQAGWDDELTELHEAEGGDGSHPIDHASRAKALEQLRRFGVGAGSHILEIGCSSGYLLKDIQSSFPQAILVGADIVTAPLHRLSSALKGVPLVQMDLLRCPLPENSFDIVIALNVLEHIEDDEAALRQMARLLRPGGALVLEVPRGAKYFDYFDAYLRHFRRYERSDLHRKMISAGFERIETKTLGWSLFPVFALIKKFNRLRYGARGERCGDLETKVRNEIRSSRASGFFAVAMRVEMALTAFSLLLPGIRLTVSARKPSGEEFHE